MSTTTSARARYRTGFDRVYDSPAGRAILERTQYQPARPRSSDPDAIDWQPPAETPAGGRDE